ncbi:MAG: PspA/IM30 family protein [Myxococcota bacterium]|nr:PspA/IM30 family protein [Myxococcota bacterium]
MGIFQRLAQVIKSNINALISKAEEPEKMLEQVMLDMNKQLVEAKRQVAVAIADEKRLAKQWEDEIRSAKEWERKAMVAVRAGDDALAKEALARKRRHADLGEQFKQQWDGQRRAVEQLKLALTQLASKIEEAKRKKSLLIARKKRAQAQKAINETLTGMSEAGGFETFKRMEERIDQMAAEAEAGVELYAEMSGSDVEQKFRELEAGPGADLELEALKRQMGLLPPAQAEAARPPAATAAAPEMTEEQVAAELEAMKRDLAK